MLCSYLAVFVRDQKPDLDHTTIKSQLGKTHQTLLRHDEHLVFARAFA